MEEILSQLQWKNFGSLYEEGGFCAPQVTNGQQEKVNINRKKARAVTHKANQLAFEHNLTRSALSHLTLGKLLPEVDISFHQRNMEFFSVQTPSEAMKKFLTEEATDGNLAWARPMLEDVRFQLLDTLNGVRYQRSTKNEKGRILDSVNGFLVDDVLPTSMNTANDYFQYKKVLATYSDR